MSVFRIGIGLGGLAWVGAAPGQQKAPDEILHDARTYAVNETQAELLRSFTTDDAFASFGENVKSSLEPGKLADLVVLSCGIMKIVPAEILKTNIDLTWLGGRIAYQE